MGTTNNQPVNPKQAKKLAEKARKEAVKKGFESVAYKFFDQKGKK